MPARQRQRRFSRLSALVASAQNTKTTKFFSDSVYCVFDSFLHQSRARFFVARPWVSSGQDAHVHDLLERRTMSVLAKALCDSIVFNFFKGHLMQRVNVYASIV